MESKREVTALKGAARFQWVVLQLEELSKCFSPRAVEAQLQSLPKNLDGLYDQILNNSINPEELKRFLMWLAFANRPLEVDELAEVVTVDFSSADGLPSYDRDLRYDDAKNALVVCSSFVTEFEGTVKLAHMSMKEYLLSKRIESGTAAFFSINEALSHSLIAQTCLAYLLDLGKVSNPVESTIQSDFPLAPYAAAHWISHMRLGCCAGSHLSQMMMKIFSNDSNALINWVRLDDPDQVDLFERDLERPAERIAAPLYYASSCGLQEVVNHLLRTGANVNARGGEYGSALAVASSKGHCSIVQELLEHGAETDAQCGEHGTALQNASHQGHAAVVRLLLENGAEVDQQCGDGTALLRASSRGHADVVRQLLDSGADVNSSEGPRSKALWVASYKGYDTVVRLLLEARADVDSAIHDGDNALHVASYEGHHAVVCLLLNNGCNVNAPARTQGSALQAASQRGHYAVVQQLLNHGARINTEEGFFGCAIQAASYAGRKDIIQRLLDNGADVNMLGGHYGSALQAAAYKGFYSVIRLLLQNGADVNAQGGLYGNALKAAISERHHQVAELLLDNGATAVQAGHLGNALHEAAYAGHEEMVQALLENDADVDAQGGQYGSPLQTASFAGHQGIVRLLLSYGADVNRLGGQHRSALQAASSKGHVKIVEMLLEHGADVNGPEGQLGSALQAASFGGHSRVVAVLLKCGADVNRLVGQGGNALQAASSKGHVKIVEMLLEHGADVNGLEGQRALQAASFGGHSRIVAVLLKHGADVNSLVGQVGNALHTAASRRHIEMVETLLEHGADVNGPAGQHANVLQAVSSAGHFEMVQDFLSLGVDYFSTSPTYRHARPFHGAVDNTVDALRLVFAARLGVIPRVLCRLNDVERRELVVSGAVFVFTVGESRIKRWTDGKVWSSSRIDGNFLGAGQEEQVAQSPGEQELKGLVFSDRWRVQGRRADKKGEHNNVVPMARALTFSPSSDVHGDGERRGPPSHHLLLRGRFGQRTPAAPLEPARHLQPEPRGRDIQLRDLAAAPAGRGGGRRGPADSIDTIAAERTRILIPTVPAMSPRWPPCPATHLAAHPHRTSTSTSPIHQISVAAALSSPPTPAHAQEPVWFDYEPRPASGPAAPYAAPAWSPVYPHQPPPHAGMHYPAEPVSSSSSLDGYGQHHDHSAAWGADAHPVQHAPAQAWSRCEAAGGDWRAP
ncbi:hypothetical protein HWV62_20716 [Athelia sp. TMB]|nr:hypothetical protein HWV62_20716 [Athelia sp. TMB]